MSQINRQKKSKSVWKNISYIKENRKVLVLCYFIQSSMSSNG